MLQHVCSNLEPGERGIMDLDDAIVVLDVLFEECQAIEIDAGAIVSVPTPQLASRRRESARQIKPSMSMTALHSSP